MRHRRGGRRFDMPTSQRRAMFRNLTTDVLRDGYVQTTEARAKELRSFIEPLITMAKDDSVANRRRAFNKLRHDSACLLYTSPSPRD